ncbi:MAG: LPP20 family lipoprotein [Spirochaetaceae bacterium]|jgi:acylphosphatase|nr:LPP20 family lipoprotein [Spirochaetaceae bacterium]
MRKFSIFALIGLVLVGCASAPKVTGSSVESTKQPDWVTKGKKSSTLKYVVGNGKMSNFSNSKKRAEADARDQIALWVSTSVTVTLKNYTQDAGVGGETQAIEFMENVSQQTSKVALRGVEIEDFWSAPDGTIFVLASIPIANVEKALEENVAASEFARKEEAAFAEFKAREAFAAAGIE